ncbi:MAG: hypothetical protein P9M12_01115 [Candidatus Aceula lacicola]|nr:hypothetical protein [Candidatus Aceula lacicola]
MGCCDQKKECSIVKWFKNLIEKMDKKMEKEAQKKSCCSDKKEGGGSCCS